MVPECAFVYPSGHHCRRIPRRGQTLCHGHLRARRLPVPPDKDAYNREISAYCDRLRALPLLGVLDKLQDSILALEPLIDRKYSRSFGAHYDRASVAVTLAIDLAGEAALAAARTPCPSPALPGPPVPAPPIPGALPAEQLEKMCEQLLKAMGSYEEPHPQ